MPELTFAKLLILIVLTKSARHGYSIMKEIERMTGGDYVVNAGTLYRSLMQLVNAGLCTTGEAFEHKDELSLKRYAITEHGREAAARELRRMKRLIESVESL